MSHSPLVSFPQMMEPAQRLTTQVLSVAPVCSNEANLRHEMELLLRQECQALHIPYAPYQLERPLHGHQTQAVYADVVHGGVIIEYEAPCSFSAGSAQAKVRHAQEQAEGYAERMAQEEGRSIDEYRLVVWDGTHIAFGTLTGPNPHWEPLVPFGALQAAKLLSLLQEQGRPLVHPGLLRSWVGPESEIGAALIPVLFCALVQASAPAAAGHSKTALLFKEWRQLFGQAVGIPTHGLKQFLQRQAQAHGQDYQDHVSCYLFALHTYIALIAKLVAALALPTVNGNITDSRICLRARLRALEGNTLFLDAGIANMLTGDFFSWPVDDCAWACIAPPLALVLGQLEQISFDMTRKDPASVRDLFKGIYEEFVPRELRHALGEIYTPDWLADHALDAIGWQPDHDLLDPTCGTGTFLLEAVRRRLVHGGDQSGSCSATDVLHGLYGIDLNPLAVLAAKASLVVALADRLNPGCPVRLPIFLADAINTTSETDDGCFLHRLQTEKGVRAFKMPAHLVHSDSLHAFFDTLRTSVLADLEAEDILSHLQSFLGELDEKGKATVMATIRVLVELHKDKWDGIWCPILADRFAAGALPPLSHIVGNPPWVKWSHLPPAYAQFIKPQCQAMNVFSEDHYVGGIESDISTVIAFQAIRRWLAPGGHLAFYITATVFANESSQGFRRFADSDGQPMCAVLFVEDFQQVRPFSGVTNHPALLVVKAGQATRFPIPYRSWCPPTVQAPFANGADFRAKTQYNDMLAMPVPGTDAGPWLKGTIEQHGIWDTLFQADAPSSYRARKGVTTDRNGIYFLKVQTAGPAVDALVRVINDPGAGRTSGIPEVAMHIETTHIFPLLRGRGLRAFCAQPDAKYRILLPQRDMHGDPALLADCPRTLKFLTRFKKELQTRASYRKYQQGRPFWSTWSTGPYTFSPYKVLWREMSGNRFCAAYTGSVDDPILGRKIVVPDHKLYMVPLDTLAEAQFLTGILNAPTITHAIAAYAAQLSLGVSVMQYLKIPPFNHHVPEHGQIVSLTATITQRGGNPTPTELQALDQLVVSVIAA